jgi:thiol:disulfide interchange protein
MRAPLLLHLALALAVTGASACGRDEAGAGQASPPAPAATDLGLGPRVDALTPAPAAAAAESWNAAQIDWQPYEAGLAKAKAQNKPLCLVLYTSWCPHCRNYSHVFDDAQVVERARSFVMVRANADDEAALARKYAPDGGYIPRTFFLAPDGTLDPEIHAPRPKFLYFYDERSPAGLLAGMTEALRKLVK